MKMNWLKRYLFRHITCSIIPEDVFKVQAGVCFIGDEHIGETELKMLKSEILLLEKLQIWKVMNETVKNLAIRKSVHEATNFEQVMSGKMALWTLEVYSMIIDKIKKAK